jgi:4-amino-4-deoxy-L-arabinose transferase-like glycosyltransferase
MKREGWLLAATAMLLALRAVMAAAIPLSADEAYYWLWSRYPDFGYFDHPPMIAWAIRAGTELLGDTVPGIRASGVVLSIAASWLVFETGLVVLGDRGKAALAALLFNLSLLVNAEMLAATPDMPSVATAALFQFALARLGAALPAKRARWWLLAGAAGGLGLLSKYSALFLAVGALLWLVTDKNRRLWLKTPWPWIAGLIALLLFAPNLLWQAAHRWETFAFQFGRVAGNRLTLRYLGEFLGAEFGLMTPGIFLMALAGLARARRGQSLFLPAALVLPALAYFLVHALHDRVQGNWPAFLMPMLAILAAAAFEAPRTRPVARAAVPLAALMLATVYLQIFTGLLALGKNDPLPRLLGAGFRAAAASLPDAEKAAGARAILTTDYETTAWLRFYRPDLKVLQLDETYRYPHAPSPSADLLRQPLLYLVEQKRDRQGLLGSYFRDIEPVRALQVGKDGQTVATYMIYRVENPLGPVPAKMP